MREHSNEAPRHVHSQIRSAHALPGFSRHGTRTVTDTFGQDDEQQAFGVYEQRLTTHSEFLNAALKKPWKEAGQRCVELAEDDPEIFEIFFFSVNTIRIFSREDGGRTADSCTKHISGRKWPRLRVCLSFS